MPNPGAFQGQRLAFLLGQKDAYAEAVDLNSAADFVADIQRRFFKRFPVDLPPDDEPTAEWLATVDDDAPDPEFQIPDKAKMSIEEYEVADKAYQVRQETISFRKEQIKRWMKNQHKKDKKDRVAPKEPSLSNPATILMAKLTGTPIAKPRKSSALNAWAAENSDTINDALEKKQRASGISREQMLKERAAITAKFYGKLNQAEKNKWEETTRLDHESALEEWTAKLNAPPSTEPEDQQRCIEGLALFVKPILDLIREHTGLHTTFIAGGPEPADGGRLNIMSLHSGTSKGSVPMNFGQAERKAWVKYINPIYGRYLKKAFTMEECVARALSDAEPLESFLEDADSGMVIDHLSWDSADLGSRAALPARSTSSSSSAAGRACITPSPSRPRSPSPTRSRSPRRSNSPRRSSSPRRSNSPPLSHSPPRLNSPLPSLPPSPPKTRSGRRPGFSVGRAIISSPPSSSADNESPSSSVGISSNTTPQGERPPSCGGETSSGKRKEPVGGSSEPTGGTLKKPRPTPRPIAKKGAGHSEPKDGGSASAKGKGRAGDHNAAGGSKGLVAKRKDRTSDGDGDDGAEGSSSAKKPRTFAVSETGRAGPASLSKKLRKGPVAKAKSVSSRASTGPPMSESGQVDELAEAAFEPRWMTSIMLMLQSLYTPASPTELEMEMDLEWRALLDEWSGYEERSGYGLLHKVAPLPATGRPKVIPAWIQRARSVSWKPGQGLLNGIGGDVVSWWSKLQPGWRTMYGRVPGNLSNLDVPGVNGVLSFIASLYFWHGSMAAAERGLWLAVVKDFRWVLEQLRPPPQEGAASSDGTPSPDDPQHDRPASPAPPQINQPTSPAPAASLTFVPNPDPGNSPAPAVNASPEPNTNDPPASNPTASTAPVAHDSPASPAPGVNDPPTFTAPTASNPPAPPGASNPPAPIASGLPAPPANEPPASPAPAASDPPAPPGENNPPAPPANESPASPAPAPPVSPGPAASDQPVSPDAPILPACLHG